MTCSLDEELCSGWMIHGRVSEEGMERVGMLGKRPASKSERFFLVEYEEPLSGFPGT